MPVFRTGNNRPSPPHKASTQLFTYDKRNVEGLEETRGLIFTELTKLVHQILASAEVKVKPMLADGLNSDARKSIREKLNQISR